VNVKHTEKKEKKKKENIPKKKRPGCGFHDRRLGG
jgi:hypothetical protein